MSAVLLARVNSELFSLFFLIFIRSVKFFIKNIFETLGFGLKFTSKLDMIGRIDIEEIRSN